MCNYFDCRSVSGSDIYFTDNRSVIALLIANREFNRVLTGCKNRTVVHGNRTVLIGTCDLVAVHIRLCSGSIKTGCV